MRDEPISGKLAGEYRIDLASRFSAKDSALNKRLSALLVVDEDNGWRVWFVVERPSGRMSTQALSTAMRKFDE